MNDFVPVLLLILLLIFFFIFIVFSRYAFFSSEKIKFSYKNRFPFELYYLANKYIATYIRIILIIIFTITIFIPIIFINNFLFTYNTSFFIIIAIMFIFTSISGFTLFILRPNFLFAFKLIVTIFLSLMMIANSMVGIILLSNLFTHYAYKIVASLFFVLVLINLLIMINPNLKKWDKLKKINNNDGSVIYVRPEISPLTISLWLNYLILILGDILLLVIIILCNLNL